MIYRKLGFEVVYQTPLGWERSRVKELHLSEGSAYDEVITFDGKTVQLTPGYTSLLEFTGKFDIDGKPIFHGHLCIDQDEAVFEVVFVDGAFQFQKGETLLPMSETTCMTMRIVGDAIRNSNLIIPDIGPEVLEAAEKKAAGEITPQ